MSDRLPPMPDFAAIDAAAPETADRRTMILALIGHLVFNWSNNESVFIHVMTLLLETDERTSVIVFSTLNTTRARLDLIQRLAKAKLTDRALSRELDKLIKRFNECTRARNEFNHTLYSIDEHGLITHTQSIKIEEVRGGLRWGLKKPLDDKRLSEIVSVVRDLQQLNRDLWAFLPRLQAGMDERSRNGPRRSGG